MSDEKHPTPAERDEPIKIDLDPETTLRGLLKVDPDAPGGADEALVRAWRLSVGDMTDEVMDEFERLIPVLVAAGYAETDSDADSWCFSGRGIAQAEALVPEDEDSELRHDAE